jgi:hypothetical protein
MGERLRVRDSDALRPPAARLKQFLDQCGPLWRAGTLKDKVVTSFTSTQNPHGGRESTSYCTGPPGEDDGQVPERFLAAARAQGRRLAHYASLLAPSPG